MGKKRKPHVLTLPKTKFHAKNQKNLSRGSPGKLSERDRQRDRQRRTQKLKLLVNNLQKTGFLVRMAIF